MKSQFDSAFGILFVGPLVERKMSELFNKRLREMAV
jgi:hypothetical protein